MLLLLFTIIYYILSLFWKKGSLSPVIPDWTGSVFFPRNNVLFLCIVFLKPIEIINTGHEWNVEGVTSAC